MIDTTYRRNNSAMMIMMKCESLGVMLQIGNILITMIDI